MRFVAVFDTNILLSGIGWNGNPFRCLELARSGTVEVVTCQENPRRTDGEIGVAAGIVE